MAVALEGHGPAAAKAEGQVDAIAAPRFILPVVEAPGLLPAVGHALPDVAAGELRVADEGDALVEGAIVVDGEGVVEIDHAGAGGEFGEAMAPAQDLLAQGKRSGMHPGLVVGAAAAGEFGVGKLIADLHDRIELDAAEISGGESPLGQGVEQVGKDRVIVGGVVATEGDDAEPPAIQQITDDLFPASAPVLEGAETVVIGRGPVDGDLDADQAEGNQLLHQCPGQQGTVGDQGKLEFSTQGLDGGLEPFDQRADALGIEQRLAAVEVEDQPFLLSGPEAGQQRGHQLVGSGVTHGGRPLETALVAVETGEVAGHAENHRDPQIGVQAIELPAVAAHLLPLAGRVGHHHGESGQGGGQLGAGAVVLQGSQGLGADNGQGAGPGGEEQPSVRLAGQGKSFEIMGEGHDRVQGRAMGGNVPPEINSV
ncbi:MAG: hypothetical protein Q7U64_02625 [Desulfocapsaceae bacterium]|nr:hypothetical protein [Desulfocapsaceae bacterium]